MISAHIPVAIPVPLWRRSDELLKLGYVRRNVDDDGLARVNLVERGQQPVDVVQPRDGRPLGRQVTHRHLVVQLRRVPPLFVRQRVLTKQGKKYMYTVNDS